MFPMKNWAGNLEFYPTNIAAPKSTQEVQSIIRDHLAENRTIRPRGSSHSWTGLIETDETYLHLDQMQGIIKVDSDRNTLKVLAGTKLSTLGEEAFKHHLALPNQGDINHQSLAGALSTGTHGTGITLQSMANFLQAMTLVAGTGEILHFDSEKDPQMMRALGVGLGAMGVITEATIQMIPSYKLKVDSFAEDMKTSLLEFKKRLLANRHLELFYFPLGDWCIAKTMNQTEEKETTRSKLSQVNDLVVENWLFEALNIFAQKMNSYKSIDQLMRKCVGKKSFIDWSHRAFPTARTVRFMEMEYNLPLEKFEEVLEEIKSSIKKNKFHTLFPIEIRFVKADNLWLSPAYERDSVYFAAHTYIKENFRPYFEELQKIFIRHGGRPHWGKWHTLNYHGLRDTYPQWENFLRLREELDPKGILLNKHLKEIFTL